MYMCSCSCVDGLDVEEGAVYLTAVCSECTANMVQYCVVVKPSTAWWLEYLLHWVLAKPDPEA